MHGFSRITSSLSVGTVLVNVSHNFSFLLSLASSLYYILSVGLFEGIPYTYTHVL